MSTSTSGRRRKKKPSAEAAAELIELERALPERFQGLPMMVVGLIVGQLVAEVGADRADQYFSTMVRMLGVATEADAAASAAHLRAGLEHLVVPLGDLLRPR